MLDNHCAQNNPNKPPSTERLLDAGRHQLGISNNEDCEEGEGEEGTSNEDQGDEDEDEDDSTRKRATHHSKSTETVRATTARCYDGTAWKKAIIHRKLAFCCYVMLQYLFSLTDSHIEEAELILSKTTANLKQIVSFSSGEFSLFDCPHSGMLIPV